MNLSSLLDKYKDIKIEHTGTLFELDLLGALKTKTCPYCFRKLYEMRSRPLWYCKNKQHKTFVVSSDKIKRHGKQEVHHRG